MEGWKQSNLETLSVVEEGDFLAVKYGPCILCTSYFENVLSQYPFRFTGAGPHVVQQLTQGVQPAKWIEAAIIEICDLAKSKRVGLLIDAEQSFLQAGIDLWMLRYQRKYN